MMESPPLADGRTRFAAWSFVRTLLGILIAAAALCFLVSRLVRDWRSVPFDTLHFAVPLLIGSFIVLLGTRFPLEALAWRRILAALGAHMALTRALAIMAVTQLGKYAPGKLWFTLGRAGMARSEGISEDRTLVSVGIEVILSFFAAVLLLAVSIPFVPRGTLPSSVYWLLLAGPLSLILLYPPLLNLALRIVLRWLGRPNFAISLPYSLLLELVALYILDWTLQGIGCFLLIRSFYALPVGTLPILLGGYASSWILGFIVLVAPAGLGIREGVYTVILSTVMPLPVAIMSALVTRIWMTISESFMAAVMLPTVIRRRKRGTQT